MSRIQVVMIGNMGDLTRKKNKTKKKDLTDRKPDFQNHLLSQKYFDCTHFKIEHPSKM